ncbi:MAG: hypothetical protein K8H88_31865 [Sandaracinaceae bacterium]|nr:hypothetical protein [Sandaracinaceae bacterium]
MTPAPTRPARPWARDVFLALAALRDSDLALAHPANEKHWRTLYESLRPVFAREGPDGDDDCQEVMVALTSSLGSMRAETPARAAAWLRAVRANIRTDRLRTRAKRSALSLDDLERPVHVASRDPVPFDRLDAVLAAFEAAIRKELERIEPSPERRASAQLHAHATVRRLVLGESTTSIARSLGGDASGDLVSKWIERGRAVVLRTVAVMREHDPDTADLYDVLADLAATRRADAGRPRPERRRSRPN